MAAPLNHGHAWRGTLQEVVISHCSTVFSDKSSLLWQKMFCRFMGLGMGKVYGTICGYYTQVKKNYYTQVKMNCKDRTHRFKFS